MSTRAEIMSLHNLPGSTRRYPFFRKVVLLFLLVNALALGLLILFRERPGHPYLLQSLFASASLAVVAGFGSRFVLSQRSGLFRFLAALAAYVIGLYLLGFASNWKYGIGPLQFWPAAIDWDGLTHLGIGVYLIPLVLSAWRPRPLSEAELGKFLPAATVQKVVQRRKARSRSKRSATSRHAASSPGTPVPQVSWPKFLSRTSSRKSRRTAPPSGTHRPHAAVQPLVVDKPVRAKRSNPFRGKPRVQLALVEEHRCPYCLEIVQRADPRGFVECDVCHSLHHKDCWEITGSCQVPHLNT
jgi:hypothetical protein